jgi:hypothetical protein
MRAPPPAPLVVATLFPLPSGLARFTSCELPNDAALFSPDMLRFPNIQLVPEVLCPGRLSLAKFVPFGVLFWFGVDVWWLTQAQYLGRGIQNP